MEINSKNSALVNAGSVIIAGGIISGAIIWSNGHPSRNVAATTPNQPPSAQAADVSKVNIANEPFIGSPNAPVTIAYWLDYQCPFCKQNEEVAIPQIVSEYVDAGIARIVFKDYQFLGPDSQTLGQTARAVWDIAPGKFYAWHKIVYDNQGTENTGWATPEKIRSITEGVLGATNTDRVLALVKANGAAYQKAMDADRAEGSGFGVTGTPSFIIGKQLIIGAMPYAQLKAAIEAARDTR